MQIRLLESTNPHPSVAQLAGLLRILAEENRLRILCLLLQGERCVAELCEALDLPQNLVSHHLGVLREAGLVTARRDPEDSRWVYYSVNTPALSALNACYDGFFAISRSEVRCLNCGPGGTCCWQGPSIQNELCIKN